MKFSDKKCEHKRMWELDSACPDCERSQFKIGFEAGQKANVGKFAAVQELIKSERADERQKTLDAVKKIINAWKEYYERNNNESALQIIFNIEQDMKLSALADDETTNPPNGGKRTNRADARNPAGAGEGK